VSEEGGSFGSKDPDAVSGSDQQYDLEGSARGDVMTICIRPVWLYGAMEEEFNRRQLAGEPCFDLIIFMIREISPARDASRLNRGGLRNRQT
jgi:hypothetical protein